MQNNETSEAVRMTGAGQEIDFLEVLKANKIWIFVATVISAACGLTYALLIPPQYEAVADIQMATVDGAMVETPVVLAEKLKLPLYYSGDTLKACGLENSPAAGKELGKRLTPSANKNAPFVSIQLRSKTIDNAKSCLEAVLVDIKGKQELLARPLIAVKKNKLNNLEQHLARAEAFRKLLPNEKPKLDFNNSQFPTMALLFLTSISKESEIQEVSNQINDLQIALKEPQTRETQLITPIYAPDIKIMPKWGLVTLLCAIFGAFLSLMFFIVRKILNK